MIVIGHPHPSWLGYQINPSSIFFQWSDFPEIYEKSMEAIFEASLVVMAIAVEEGIDFMSDSSYGLEMTSPALLSIIASERMPNISSAAGLNEIIFP